MSSRAIDVLLVEDNAGDARLVVEMLRESGSDDFRLHQVSTLGAAIEHLLSGAGTDVILLDLSLPDESGLATVRRIVANAGGISVVVMTGADDEVLGISAMQVGAQDYLVKGSVDGHRLRRVLRFAIERQGKFQRESQEDDLTGLQNRRGFLELAEQQLAIARRNRNGFLVLLLDLDGLKDINDSCGHAEGNRALQEAADVLRGTFRQSDIVGRIGGDEFAALAMGSADTSEAIVRARLASALDAVNDKPDRSYALGFSVGVLQCEHTDTRSVEALLEAADALMYEEKRMRRAGRHPRQVEADMQAPPA
jgi:diguanylate cyclase (GGDEF)-like protein